MPTIELPARRPTSIAALADDVAQAAHQGHRIRIEGSGSSASGAGDARSVQVIATPRMNKLLEHAVGDMTVTVQAGITLDTLQRELAWRNQWLPVDPPGGTSVLGSGRGRGGGGQGSGRGGTRTIGGLIATNALGPLRFGCGDWRLLVLGIRWVDAAGRIIKGGGRTVKNVAGYSTPRMLIGSRGALGVIAEVTLRTFARPADEQSVLFYCDDAASAEALLANIMKSPTSPAYVQAIGSRTFATNALQMPAPDKGLIIAAGFLGREEVCAAQIETLRTIAGAGIEAIALGAAQSGRLRLWMTTEAPGTKENVSFRLFARSSQAAALVHRIEAVAPDSAWVVSEAGSGVIRGHVAEGARKAVETEAENAGAVVDWLGSTNIPVPAGSGTDLAQRIKQAIDPEAVFGDV